jgi:pyruvate kinase
MRRTKIVATLGPASDSAEVIRRLIEAGLDVARVNFSHGTYEQHAARIARVRAQAEAVGKPVAILQDLRGPKIRTGQLVEGRPVILEEGATFTITTTPIAGTAERVSTDYQALPNDVQPGDRVLLSDGLIQLRVIDVRGTDVVTEVVYGGALAERQGINLPNATVSAPAITEKDRADLAFGLEQNVDYVAMSFVRRAADVQQLKDLIAESGKNIPVVAKIEKPQALDDLPAILGVTDAVMVARGDLGVEMSPEQVPLVQKNLIRAANKQNILVITATQMLESMIHNARPTRAEASDVANAIFDGTDAIMLSGETAVGSFPVEAVQMMHRIAVTTEESDRYHEHREALQPVQPLEKLLSSHEELTDTARAISHAASAISVQLHVTAVVAFTLSGHTARLVSKKRPLAPILALTTDQRVVNRMALYWGVQPMLCPPMDRLEDLTSEMQRLLLEGGYVQRGDRVVMTGGHPLLVRGPTNFIKIVEIA